MKGRASAKLERLPTTRPRPAFPLRDEEGLPCGAPPPSYSMAFEDLGTWSVSARLDGEEKFNALFVQTVPEDAVTLMVRVARTNFAVVLEQWRKWTFFCGLRHSAEVRTVVFRVSSAGSPVKAVDSGAGASQPRSSS